VEVKLVYSKSVSYTRRYQAVTVMLRSICTRRARAWYQSDGELAGLHSGKKKIRGFTTTESFMTLYWVELMVLLLQ